MTARRPASLPDLPRVEVASREALRDWLARHHADSGSIWLVTAKAGRAGHIGYDAIVEEALCFGWVDSRPARLDADRSMLMLSPRKAGSNWSGLNRARVERLTAAGLMAPAGLSAVARAKADGTWTALDGVEALEEPDDLKVALDAMVDARRLWDRFPPSSRRGILEWIAAARRPETRAQRIAETALKAALNIKANFPAGRDSGPKPGSAGR